MNNSKIILKREKKAWVHRFAKYQVHIDGLTDSIANGEEKEFQITAGRHYVSLEVKIGWETERSQILTVDVGENETVRLVCKPQGTVGKIIAPKFGIAGALIHGAIKSKDDL